MKNQSGFAPIQIIISIIAGAVMLGGIVGGVLYFAKQPSQSIQGKCGDGMCGAAEKANPNLCPRDCTKEQVAPVTEPTKDSQIPKNENAGSVESSSKDSPFGIFGANEWRLDSPNIASAGDISAYLKDLGVKWTQEMYFKKELNNLPAGINVYSRVGMEGDLKPPEATSEKYKEELGKVIEQHKDRIKYWEVATEPNGFPPPKGWVGYEKEYAEHLKSTYEIIKSKCPDCFVVFGGLGGVGSSVHPKTEEFLDAVLKAGAVGFFDVFEFKQHSVTADQYTALKTRMNIFGSVLDKYGIDIKKIPVFVETAAYDGDPAVDKPPLELPLQTESQQSAALLKTYAYGIAQGIDKIFWNLTIERHNFGNSSTNPFNFYGLVNNPSNDGQSHKKLAYYTYKKMVEVLDGSDWNNIQTIQESGGVYVYKFTKQGKPIWVAWNDNSGSKQITISGITSNSVKITEAVPKYESGKEVTDYATAFNSETKTVSDGKVTITLKDKPVFVE